MRNRIAPITSTSWIMLPFLAFVMTVGVVGSLFVVQLVQSNTTTTTTSSFSGLETIDGRLGLLHGCSDGQVEKWTASSGTWGCADDSTTAVTGAGADVLDLGDDGSDESTDFNELATINDTNNIVTEPSADKVLFDFSQDYPNAATATALAANPADCAANQYATTIAANGDLTCGSIVDADVPNTITIDLATNATNLASNPTDCAADTKADSIDAQGDLTCTAVDTGDITDGTILEADLAAVDAAVDEECLTYEATVGDFEWQTCGGGGGSVDAEEDNVAVVSGATAFDFGAGFDVTDDGGEADISYDGTELIPGCTVVAADTTPAAIQAAAYAVTDNTDDDVQIQDALNNFDCVQLIGRQFTVGTTLLLNDGNRLEGISRNPFNPTVALVGTEIKLANSLTDEHTIAMTGSDVRHFSLRNFWVNANGDNQSGSNSDGIHIDWTGSSVTNARRVVMENVGIFNSQRDGLLLDQPAGLGGGVADLSDILIIQSGRYGFHLQAPDGVYVNMKVFNGDDDGIVMGDNSGNSEFIGGFSKNNTNRGVEIASGGNRSIFLGTQIQDNGQHGAYVNRDDILFQGVVFDSNGQTTLNTYDNLFIDTLGDDVTVADSMFVDRQGTPEIRYHINVSAAGVNNFRMTGGFFDGNAQTSTVNDAGTGTQIAHTTGFTVLNNRHIDHAVMPGSDCNAADQATQYVTGTHTFSCMTFDLDDFQAATDDTVLVGNGSIFENKAIADCNTNNRDRVQYDTATNAFSCDTDTLGTADVAGLDVSDDLNLTAGRSLTLTGDDVAADAELYTDTKCIWFEDPVAADDFNSIWRNSTGNDVTLTEIWAESDQTVNFDLQVDDGTPADVNGTDISPAAGEAEDTSLSGDTTLAQNEELDLAITSVSGTPTWVSICWTFTWND